MALILAMIPFALFSCNDKNDDEDPSEQEEPSDSNSDNDAVLGDDSTGSDKKNGVTTLKLARNLDKIKILGRTSKLTTGIGVDHTASGIEFKGNFQGDVKIKIKQAKLKDGCNETYFTVYVDGERQAERFAVSGSTLKTLTLASFATEGEHTIRIVKQTESNYTLSEFVEISFKGEIFDAPANNDTYIEFIGDSLTCGMGNLPAENGTYPSDSSVAQTSPYEDGTQSYGYIAAEALGADYSIVSESGIGLSATWFDPMPDFYTAISYNRNPNNPYSFERVPDLVVINLGTNDYYINSDTNHAQSSNATPEKFEAKVKEFIQTVRGSYGENMPIVWVSRFVGIGDAHVAAIDSAIASLGGESAGLFRVDVTKNTAGAQGHPTVAGHERAASELVAYIRSKNLLVEKEYDVVNYLSLATNAAKVRQLGRTQVLSSGIAVDHTASGIEFKGSFEGDVKIKIYSTSSHAPYGAGTSRTYFTVYVDGVRQSTRYSVPDGTTELTVATFSDRGEHTIKVVKQTENNYTLCDFKELIFKGKLSAAPAENDLLIEFVGDSITCGVGNVPRADGTHPTGGGSAQRSEFEDGTKTYAYLTAEALGADSTMVSEAAMGISASWYDPFFDYYNAASYNRSTSVRYNFTTARVPDILVINQGTNDAAFGGSGFSDPSNAWYQQHVNAQPENFKKCIKDFINYARQAYGEDMPIVWVKNSIPISATYTNAIVEAINELGGESAGIYICTVTSNNTGGEGHPTAEAHAVMANELVAFMRSKNLV